MGESVKTSYSEAILSAFTYLLDKYPSVFTIGQGLWAPWYVGSTMTDLEKRFGTARVIDTPVSELGCTGAAIGASLFGYRPIVIHPRMDFMLLAVDQIVNQAAKWRHMSGGQTGPAVTIRAIINRGGEQGAQHSQALHAWFAHIPGLRVVMPATPRDARDLLVASVLCDDPVMYIDDRWLYEQVDVLGPIEEKVLAEMSPAVLREGSDITLVGAGYSTYLCCEVADMLFRDDGIAAEVVDLRVLNPLDSSKVVDSAIKTRRLCVVDGGWRTAGLAGEIIARVAESAGMDFGQAMRVTLPDAPAPTSGPLEAAYYPTAESIATRVKASFAL